MAMTEPTTIALQCYTPEDVAERWKCSPSHVRKLINSGGLRAWKLGGKLLRIRPEDVEIFEQQQAVVPAPVSSGPSAEDHVASLRDVINARRRRARMGL